MALRSDQGFDQTPVEPHQGFAQAVDGVFYGSRVLVARDQHAGQPVQHAPLEGQDTEEERRQGPARGAYDEVRRLGHGGRFEGRIARALAVTHDGHPLACELFGPLELRHVKDFARETLFAGEGGAVRTVRVGANAHGDQVEDLALFLSPSSARDAPCPLGTTPGDFGHLGLEADMGGNAKVVGEIR